MVYVPMMSNGSQPGEFLILDLWNNMDGLNQFFANPQVQEEGSRIFSQRDPVVWMPADGFLSYHIPAPFGRNDRVVATVRGPLSGIDQGRAIHNKIVASFANKARLRGHLSHDAYLRLTPPGTTPSLEFFAIDVWMDAAGMGEHYQDPEITTAFQDLFAGPPAADIWTHPAGEWVEW
jgi:quinol monooxygenase YgiN